MKIRVIRRYDGNRTPEIVETGIYDAEDQRLYGLAVYLVDNGNAIYYTEPEKIIADKEDIGEVVITSEDKKPTKRGR